MPGEREGITVAEVNASIAVAVSSDRMNGTTANQVDDTDKLIGNSLIHHTDQSASLREGSENSDSTLTMA